MNSIKKLDLSTRSYNGLHRSCIDTIEQLQKKIANKEPFLTVRGAGKKCRAEILEKLTNWEEANKCDDILSLTFDLNKKTLETVVFTSIVDMLSGSYIYNNSLRKIIEDKIDEIVREYKNQIIVSIVERASDKLYRKALPKVLENSNI